MYNLQFYVFQLLYQVVFATFQVPANFTIVYVNRTIPQVENISIGDILTDQSYFGNTILKYLLCCSCIQKQATFTCFCQHRHCTKIDSHYGGILNINTMLESKHVHRSMLTKSSLAYYNDATDNSTQSIDINQVHRNLQWSACAYYTQWHTTINIIKRY